MYNSIDHGTICLEQWYNDPLTILINMPDFARLSIVDRLSQHTIFNQNQSFKKQKFNLHQFNQTLQYTAHNGLLYVLSKTSATQIHVIDTKQSYTDSTGFIHEYWSIECINIDINNVTSILINKNGTHLVLYSRNSIFVVQLPSHYSSRYNTIKCNAITINTYYFSNVLTSISHLQWSYISPIHLYVLTNNNVLRVFNTNDYTNNNVCTHESEYDLNQYHTDTNNISLIRSKRNIKSLQYIQYISFCLLDSSQTWDVFNVYLMTSSGDISILSPVLPVGAIISSAAILSLIQQQKQLLHQHSDDIHAQHCLQYLRQTFFLLGDDETSASLDETLTSKPTLDYNNTQLIGPLSVGNNNSSSAAATLLSLRTISLPHVLLRIHNDGLVDVILGINSIQPLLHQSSIPLQSHHVLASFIPIEQIQLDIKHSEQQIQSNDIIYSYDQSNNHYLSLNIFNQLYLLQFNWLSYTTQLLNSVDESDQNTTQQLITALQNIQTDVIEYNTTKHHNNGLSLLSHPLLGTLIIQHSNDNTLNINTVQWNKLYEIQSQLHTELYQSESTDKPFDLHDYHIIPFKQQIDYFVTKYNNSYRLSVNNELRGNINIRDWHKLKHFTEQRKQYIDVYTDCITIHTDILNRIDLLQYMTNQQQNVVDEITNNINVLYDNQSTIRRQVELQTDIQSILTNKSKQLLRCILQSNQSQPLTPADLAFYTEIKHIQNNTDTIKQQIHNINTKLHNHSPSITVRSTISNDLLHTQLNTQQLQLIENVLIQQNTLCQQLVGEVHELQQQLPSQLNQLT